jgi:hypothetical protein
MTCKMSSDREEVSEQCVEIAAFSLFEHASVCVLADHFSHFFNSGDLFAYFFHDRQKVGRPRKVPTVPQNLLSLPGTQVRIYLFATSKHYAAF